MKQMKLYLLFSLIGNKFELMATTKIQRNMQDIFKSKNNVSKTNDEQLLKDNKQKIRENFIYTDDQIENLLNMLDEILQKESKDTVQKILFNILITISYIYDNREDKPKTYACLNIKDLQDFIKNIVNLNITNTLTTTSLNFLKKIIKINKKLSNYKKDLSRITPAESNLIFGDAFNSVEIQNYRNVYKDFPKMFFDKDTIKTLKESENLPNDQITLLTNINTNNVLLNLLKNLVYGLNDTKVQKICNEISDPINNILKGDDKLDIGYYFDLDETTIILINSFVKKYKEFVATNDNKIIIQYNVKNFIESIQGNNKVFSQVLENFSEVYQIMMEDNTIFNENSQENISKYIDIASSLYTQKNNELLIETKTKKRDKKNISEKYTEKSNIKKSKNTEEDFKNIAEINEQIEEVKKISEDPVGTLKEMSKEIINNTPSDLKPEVRKELNTIIKKEIKEEKIIQEGTKIIEKLEEKIEDLKEELKEEKIENKFLELKLQEEKQDNFFIPKEEIVNTLMEEAQQVASKPVEALKEIQKAVEMIKDDEFKGSSEEKELKKLINKEKKEEEFLKEGPVIIDDLKEENKFLIEELKDNMLDNMLISKEEMVKNLIKDAQDIANNPVKEIEEIKKKVEMIKGDDFEGSPEEEKLNELIKEEKKEEQIITKAPEIINVLTNQIEDLQEKHEDLEEKLEGNEREINIGELKTMLSITKDKLTKQQKELREGKRKLEEKKLTLAQNQFQATENQLALEKIKTNNKKNLKENHNVDINLQSQPIPLTVDVNLNQQDVKKSANTTETSKNTATTGEKATAGVIGLGTLGGVLFLGNSNNEVDPLENLENINAAAAA